MTFSFDKRFFRQFLIGPVFAFVTVLFTLVLFDTSFMFNTMGTNVFPAIERRGYDILMRARGVRESANDVVLIKIDDYTDNQLGWPIRRDYFGTVAAVLSSYGAKAIALDVLLPKKAQGEDSDENAALVELVATTNNFFPVIGPSIPSVTAKEKISRRDVDSTAHFAIGHLGYPMPRRHHFFRAPYVNDYPFPELAAVSAGTGHALLIPDSLDGVIRSVPLFVEYAGKLYPSIGLALALHVRGINPNQIRYEYTDEGMNITAGNLTLRTGLWGEMSINYIGSRNDLPSVSFIDILLAVRDRNEKFFEQFRNKVCIIGPTIRSVGDYYSTPVDESSPGYVTHANIYDMVVTGNFLYPAPTWAAILLLILTTFAVGFVAHSQHMRTGVIILFAVIVATSIFAYLSFATFNIWFPIVQTLFSMIFCFIATVAYRAATEGRQRRIITDMFGRYVDSTVVNTLINDPTLVKLGGEKRELTLLFTDIKGFSSISEKVSDETLVKLLNTYLTEMTTVILKHKGTVDKFIGDAIMAFWGAPLRDPDAAYNACRAALEMQEKLGKLQSKLQKIANVELLQRVGINSGMCTVGNMGSDAKINYTAIGDPVNLASRLEGANKQFGTGILISEYTFQKVTNRIVTREVDRVIVAGKTEPVRIYELLDTADHPLSDKLKSFLDVYADALKAYQERRWDEGIAMMAHAMTFMPNDPVCLLFIERMKLYQLTPPGKDWKGVFILHSK
jgi:adenylate cyclase